MRNGTIFLLIIILTTSLFAFGDIQTGSTGSGTSSMLNRSIVRDSGGWLYAVYINTETDPKSVWISRSTDGGMTWDSEWQEVTDTSSYGRHELISGCSMAIDDDDKLYVLWHRYQYSPTHHSAYLRRCADIGTSPAWSDIHCIFTASIKTNDSGIAIDSDGYVWLITGGPTNWKSQLWKSTLPYAEGFTFEELGCPSSGSSQGTSICIDAEDNVHVGYYDSGVSTNYAMHRIYDGTSWQPTIGVGNGSSGGRDHNCGLSADALGNVHILYGDNVGDVSSTWHFRYRLWHPDSGMGDPVDIASFATTLYDGVANRNVSSIACNEATGEVFVLLRDLSEGGSLCLYSKGLDDSAFTMAEEITGDTMALHYYYLPRIRGCLYPPSNRTGNTIEMSWVQDRSGSAHAPFYRYQLSEGPYLTTIWPPFGSWVTEDTFVVLIFTDYDGLDESSVELSVNSTVYTGSDDEVMVSGDSVIFRDSSEWENGDTVTIELIAIADLLGNESPDSGTTVAFYVDKAPPFIAYREPDSAEVFDFIPTGAMIEYYDAGSGTDSMSWMLTIEGNTLMAPSGPGLMIEGDSVIYVSYAEAGISIPEDDTAWIEFMIADKPDIGSPNIHNYMWWFYSSTGIEEASRPGAFDISISPNPFNSAVTIEISNLPDGVTDPIICVTDISGRTIDEIDPRETSNSTGNISVVWCPEREIPSGIYYFRLKGNAEEITKTGVYLK